jgi:thiosulfate/3-mercaptopyruvate sulfurtransferase
LIFVFSVKIFAQVNYISAKEFNDYAKKTPGLIIIDASKTELYDKAHLKGAISLPYKELNQKEGKVEGLMETPENMAKVFGMKGISENDAIVVYDEGSQKYSSRVYWLLKYLGASNVKLMHKENNAWRDARILLTSEPTKLKAKTFTPKVNPNIAIDVAGLEAKLNSVKIIDAREAAEYSGTETGDKAYSKGHFPKAVSVEFKSLLNADDSYKSIDELTKLFTDKGLTPDKSYVIYCKTGVKASVVYFALVEMLKYPNVQLYDGGYVEWEAEGKPIEK